MIKLSMFNFTSFKSNGTPSRFDFNAAHNGRPS